MGRTVYSNTGYSQSHLCQEVEPKLEPKLQPKMDLQQEPDQKPDKNQKWNWSGTGTSKEPDYVLQFIIRS
jgi:hypothetical protein